jgi:tetratricopeptide (TPR) repeat protein
LAFQLDLGVALLATRGWNAADDAYRRAGELAQRIGDDRRRFQAAWGLWIGSVGVDYEAARAFNAELFRIAKRLDDPALLLEAHHSAWATALWESKLDAVVEHTGQGLALYDSEKHRAHAFLYGGHDAGVCGHSEAAIAQWLLGFPDQAEKSARQAVTLGERLLHPPSLAHGLFFTALYYYFKRDVGAVLLCTERAMLIADEHRLTLYGAGARVLRGWAIVERGDAAHGLVELRRGLDDFTATNSKDFAGCLRSALAESYARTGKIETGLVASQEALEAIAGGAERFWKAGALSVRGDLLLAAGRQEEGVVCLKQAIELARARRALA